MMTSETAQVMLCCAVVRLFAWAPACATRVCALSVRCLDFFKKQQHAAHQTDENLVPSCSSWTGVLVLHLVTHTLNMNPTCVAFAVASRCPRSVGYTDTHYTYSFVQGPPMAVHFYFFCTAGVYDPVLCHNSWKNKM